MTDLPAYTGLRALCPKCGCSDVLTEWHSAGGVLAHDKKMARREPPCKAYPDLAKFDGSGEHLCRVCAHCRYGWVEACKDGDDGTAGEQEEGPLCPG